MKPKTLNTDAQQALIQGARDILVSDERIGTCWLEGSFATDTADPWSDVDLHIAAYDQRFHELVASRLELLGSVRPLLSYGDAALPWGAHLLYATVSGPLRIDLYFERLGELESALRWEQPKVLFDWAGAAARLKPTGDPAALLRPWLEERLRAFFFGAMWPVRLWGRQEWGTLLMNAAAVVFQFLVPAMLARDDPKDYHRAQYHNEHLLPPERRQEVGDLLAEIVLAFRGVGSSTPDHQALARLHERLIGAIWRELRAVCQELGVAYPEQAEQEMRDYYRRELGLNV